MTLMPYIIRRENDMSPAYCSKCGEDKLPTEFYIHSRRFDGAIRYRGICKACKRKGRCKTVSRPIHDQIINTGVQVCKYCNNEKPISDFYANGCFGDGVKKFRTRCKLCVLKLRKDKYPDLALKNNNKRSSSYKAFIARMLNHANKRKTHLGFDLDVEYLIKMYESQNGLCAISGVKMTNIAGKGRQLTNISLDRIDSSIGYLRGNVQLVCDIVNVMKSSNSLNDLIYWCTKIIENNKL